MQQPIEPSGPYAQSPSSPRSGRNGDGGLDRLLDPALDPLFARPSRLGPPSAWYPHLPFAGWLVRTLAPRTLVELGTHTGVSYAGFCDQVARSGLSTRCFAIDSWVGDDHAGFYGREVLDELRAFHDQRYGAFSRLLQMRFDEALSGFADGEIDLLHIDGRHFHQDVSEDYRSWLPKLSPGAVVLFHDSNVRERAFGVWRLWAELRGQHPCFEFLHGFGLGVLAPGGNPPAALRPLFALGDDPVAAARLRDRVALLGERWHVDHLRGVESLERSRLASQGTQAQARIAALEADAASRDQLAESLAAAEESLRILSGGRDRLRDELAIAKADRYRLAETEVRHARERQDQVEEQARQQARADAAAGNAARILENALAASRARERDALRRAEAQGARAASERNRADRRIVEAGQALDTALRDGTAARQAIARLEAALDDRDQRLLGQAQALRSLQASKAWRLTGPLRVLGAWLSGRSAAGVPELVLPERALPAVGAHPQPQPQPQPQPAADASSTELEKPHSPADAGSPATDVSAAPAGADVAATDRFAPESQEPEPAAGEPSDTQADQGTGSSAPDPTSPGRHPLAASGWRQIRRVLFVAGEPGTPGAAYRTRRNAAACRATGIAADCVDIFEVNPDNLAAADLVVLWRAGFSGHVQTLIHLATASRTRVAFDVDDLIVQPSLAVAEIIDGIRTTFVTEAESRSYFQSMQRTLTNAELCLTTTAELAEGARAQHPVVHVVPNSFDQQTERAARHAVRMRGERTADGLIRFGYAGGTRTHQKDFAVIAGPLARVLAARPDVRLVLFKDGDSGEGLILLDEFPALLPFQDRIEWRDMVPLDALPVELARFDVSLCPLEQGNPFCEAKSELKYFESALAGTCLVATPTGPFRRAVQDGVTGFLPDSAAAWETALLRLADDPDLRRRVARSAYHDSLWQFGPRRQAELWAMLLTALDGGAQGARAGALSLARGAYRSAGLPEIPDAELLYSYDALGAAEVTIGMTSYNYEAYIGEALESVLAQTLFAIDLVVVDDGSGDGSVPLLLDWAERNCRRFNRLRILRTEHNAGLGGARNLVFDQAETAWIMVLDSDNRLAPHACEHLLQAVTDDPLAAFAYPQIRQFGGADTLMGAHEFDPARLASGNYIDAMALVAKWAWAAAGGYYVRRDAMGWEDFSLWCRLAERGLYGIHVAQELALYRVHATSMVNAITEQDNNKQAMVSFIEQRHDWLRLRMRASRKRR